MFCYIRVLCLLLGTPNGKHETLIIKTTSGSPMKYHVGDWATLFVTTDWVPKVNLLHFGRLQGSTQGLFATNWQDKPGIFYRMGIYVSRKRIVSGPSARHCPLQDCRTLNEFFTSIHPNSDSSDVVPRMLCLKISQNSKKSVPMCTLPRKMYVFHSFWLFFS